MNSSRSFFALLTYQKAEKSLSLISRDNRSGKLAFSKIEATDRQIDQLAYELYGLTEVEMQIVEDGK